MASETGVLDVPPDRDRAEGSPAPGQDAADRHGRRPHRRRRRAQARPGRRASPTATGWRRTWSTSRTCPRACAERPDHQTVAAAPAGLRLHPRRPAPAPHADGAHRRGADRLDGHRTRRWPCCRTGRGCSTTTSRSSSPRSPTRRSTRSAKSWSPRWPRRSAPRATCSKPRPRPAGRSRSSTRSSTTTRSPSSATCRRARRSARRRCRCSTTPTRTARGWNAPWTRCAARPARRWRPVTAS